MTGSKKAHRAQATPNKPAKTPRRPKIRRMRVALGGMLAATTLALSPAMNALQQVRGTGELHLVGVSSPTTFFQKDGHVHGLQYELAQQFANELGVKLVIDPVNTPQAVLGAIRRNQAQLALTTLSADDPRLKRLRVSDPVLEVRQQLIQRSDHASAASLDDLDNQVIAALAGSAEARYLKQALKTHPQARLVEIRQADTLDLLSLLDQGKIDYAAVSAEDFDAYRGVFPNLQDSLNLERSDNIAWVFMKSADQSLYAAAQSFLARKQADGTLDRLTAFYSTGKAFDGIGVKHFHKDIAQRLPRFQVDFEQQAAQQGLDWQLLAAIAYQESHWNPQATSPTGVQGLMMLTAGTADMVGVKNRRHAGQSIQGGATYFKRILDNIPATVPEPDRTWMALAAYNMGPGHLIGARKLTRRLHGDPNSWLDVSRNLVQLAQDNRRQGKAAPDVDQALHYVQQVRRYYDAIALNSARDRGSERVASIDRQLQRVR